MRKLILASLVLALTIPATSTNARQPQGPRLSANPSAAIAAEFAFARLAQDKGQWTAFRATAAEDAVMFAPQMVRAKDWLKGRADPPVAVRWQPHRVWSSCDGSLAITQGAWQRPGSVGYFTTVWQRQRDGGYKWVFDHGDTLAEAQAAPEMIAAKVADCPPRRPRKPPVARVPKPFDPAAREGRSDDGTLVWTVTAEPGGAHNFSAELTIDGKPAQIAIEEVSAGE